MTDPTIDPAYLQYQYGDAEKLRIRQESHERYGEHPQSFLEWMLPHIAPQPGLLLLDVGCGPGTYHALLGRHGVRIIGADSSFGMAREARRQAMAHALPVLAVQANAETLPLPDASCDRVMANHMLYHVPDQMAALYEMRRVVKPGGRAILATNAAVSSQRLADLHHEAAERLGYSPTGSLSARFTLDDLPLVRSVFPGAERHVYDDAFLFPTAEAALRYYASAMVDAIAERPEDGSHRARLLPVVEARIREIIAREGVFRVPKAAGCFVAAGSTQ